MFMETKHELNSGSDFTAKLELARQQLPLRRLMESRGRGPSNGIWKFFPCPYCQNKASAGLFQARDRDAELFKCHHPGCPSGTHIEGGAWDEMKFLAFELKCSPKEAYIAWVKEAGLWQETRNPPKPLAKNEPPVAPPEISGASGFMMRASQRIICRAPLRAKWTTWKRPNQAWVSRPIVHVSKRSGGSLRRSS